MLFYVLFPTLLHLPPLRFHCVRGCWDRTHDNCDSLVVRRSNHLARSGSHPHLVITLWIRKGFHSRFVSNIWIRIRVRIQIHNEPMRIHNTDLYKLLSLKAGSVRRDYSVCEAGSDQAKKFRMRIHTTVIRGCSILS